MEEVLKYLVSAGGASAVASFILELVPAYRNWSNAEGKKWAFFGVSLALSLGAFVVITFVPVEILKQIEPWAVLIIGVFTSQFLGTAFHKTVK
jgi:hypothetical protein